MRVRPGPENINVRQSFYSKFDPFRFVHTPTAHDKKMFINKPVPILGTRFDSSIDVRARVASIN